MKRVSVNSEWAKNTCTGIQSVRKVHHEKKAFLNPFGPYFSRGMAYFQEFIVIPRAGSHWLKAMHHLFEPAKGSQITFGNSVFHPPLDPVFGPKWTIFKPF